MVANTSGPARNTQLKRFLKRPQLTLVSRLSLGFGLVGLGVFCMLLVSLHSLQQSSHGLNALVDEAMPVKEALADARLTLKDISTGAAEHYNAREVDALAAIRSRVEADIVAFNKMADGLATDYPLLSQSPELEARLMQPVEQAREQFEFLHWNMNTHRRSIEAEARIAEVRREIDALRAEAGPALDQNLIAMQSVEARTLAFRLQRLFDTISLLAINASLADSLGIIEAARAGEQGRGFAVVADEVRTLASRTQTYTLEIGGKVDRVMAGSRDAVASISTSVRDANDISDRVGHVQQAFNEYLTCIARVSELNEQVSVATDEQQAVSEDITKRTNTISDNGSTIAADFETTAQRAEALNGIADHLDQAIKRFQL